MPEDFVRVIVGEGDEETLFDMKPGEWTDWEGSINGAPITVRIQRADSESEDDTLWVLFIDGPDFHEPDVSVHEGKLSALGQLIDNYAQDADPDTDVVEFVRSQGLTVWLLPKGIAGA